MSYNCTAGLYDTCDLINASDMGSIMRFSNNAVDGLLAVMFVLALFFIIIMTLRKYDFAQTLAVASFITFLVSGLLAYAQMLNILFPLGFLILLALDLLWLFTTNK